MKSAAIPVPMHRVQRAESWARLWLIWFAGRLIAWFGLFAPIPRNAARNLHSWLDDIARLVCCIIFLRVAARARMPHQRALRPPAQLTQRRALRGGDLRALFGAALRRHFRRGGIGQRLCALSDALANLEPLVGKLARRLANGLTRRRPVRARPERTRAAAFAAPLQPAPAADTS